MSVAKTRPLLLAFAGTPKSPRIHAAKLPLLSRLAGDGLRLCTDKDVHLFLAPDRASAGADVLAFCDIGYLTALSRFNILNRRTKR